MNRKGEKILLTYVSLTTSIGTMRRSAPPAEDNVDDDISKYVCEVKEKTRLVMAAAFISIISYYYEKNIF